MADDLALVVEADSRQETESRFQHVAHKEAGNTGIQLKKSEVLVQMKGALVGRYPTLDLHGCESHLGVIWTTWERRWTAQGYTYSTS